MVRYLIAAIMSLGFIGTLSGLTSAIGNADLARTEEGMSILTSYLNVAFDTTLVALVLGLILNYLYYNYLGDRKSTRLNSSHVAISYAVFCLIKKTSCLDKHIKECSSSTRFSISEVL